MRVNRLYRQLSISKGHENTAVSEGGRRARPSLHRIKHVSMPALIKTTLLQGQGNHQPFKETLPTRSEESHLGTKPGQSDMHPQEIYCLQHCPTHTKHADLYATIKEIIFVTLEY